MLRITLSYGNAKRLRELSIRYSDRDWDHINAKPWQPRTWISLNIISNHRRDQICIYTLKHILLQVIRFLHHYRHGHSDHSRRHGRSDHSRRHEHSDQKKKKTATEALLLRFCCGATGNRTRDTRIFSPLLYQLSYGTIFTFELAFFSFGIAKVDIFLLPPNFFAKIFQKNALFSFFAEFPASSKQVHIPQTDT